MKRHHLPLVAIALTVFAATGTATSLVQLSVQQLTQASAVILRGHAVNQVSRWNANHTSIETLTTIAVDQSMKGQPASTVVVRQTGGTVGRIREYVPGSVRFLPGAGYMLFLEPSQIAPSEYLVVGMMQGAYRVFRDPNTGEERVINPTGKYFHGTRGPVSSVPSSPQTVPLRQFQQQVAGAISAPVVIPTGTAIPLKIESASFDGVGRMALQARTTADLFPNDHLVVPAQSTLTGYGQRVAGHWVVHWSTVEIGGTPVKIRTAPERSLGAHLSGEKFVAVVR
ncbi:MAG TPA: hypothetical protein VMX16_05805 [Terriglobia bacterium]|nr:hypothetical protein [Terriglobia bacterium]